MEVFKGLFGFYGEFIEENRASSTIPDDGLRAIIVEAVVPKSCDFRSGLS